MLSNALATRVSTEPSVVPTISRGKRDKIGGLRSTEKRQKHVVVTLIFPELMEVSFA